MSLSRGEEGKRENGEQKIESGPVVHILPPTLRFPYFFSSERVSLFLSSAALSVEGGGEGIRRKKEEGRNRMRMQFRASLPHPPVVSRGGLVGRNSTITSKKTDSIVLRVGKTGETHHITCCLSCCMQLRLSFSLSRFIPLSFPDSLYFPTLFFTHPFFFQVVRGK